MFVPDRLFQSSLMFVSRAKAYLSEEPSRGLGMLWAEPTNIRLGWNSLPVTNMPAYWAHL
jgi:hypothetical protein